MDSFVAWYITMWLIFDIFLLSRQLFVFHQIAMIFITACFPRNILMSFLHKRIFIIEMIMWKKYLSINECSVELIWLTSNKVQTVYNGPHSFNKLVYVWYETIVITHTMNNHSCLDINDVHIGKLLSPVGATITHVKQL